MVFEHVATGFLPSEHGFAFGNSWPEGPAVSVPLGAGALRIGTLGIGNAGRGLCGGMVFAALDYWHAGVAPPAERPEPGTPLFRVIVRRLVDSWRLPAGVARYSRWMLLPDGDKRSGARPAGGRTAEARPAGALTAGVASRTTQRHWPGVRAMLDAGVPAPLGVVTVASANPLLLGANHQV